MMKEIIRKSFGKLAVVAAAVSSNNECENQINDKLVDMFTTFVGFSLNKKTISLITWQRAISCVINVVNTSIIFYHFDFGRKNIEKMSIKQSQ